MLPRHSAAGAARRHSTPVYLLAAILGVVLFVQLTGWLRTHHAAAVSASIASSSSSSSGNSPQVQDAVAAAAAAAGHSAAALAANGTGDAAAGWDAGPPYTIPKLIHQTVRNKSRLSCEEKKVIASWKRLNPGHTHTLWDDADMRAFMVQHYPELVPMPYDRLLAGAERADLWRVLVLHKLGGVYADIDVQCLRPVDEWAAAHAADTAVVVGLENFNATRKPHRFHITNWALASVPGHPMLGRFPAVVARATQQQYLELARDRESTLLSKQRYEEGIIDRTGPAALTTALYEYLDSVGFDLNTKSLRDVDSRQGVAAGGVRVLPVAALSSGWLVAAARKAGKPLSCDDIGRKDPSAYVCHQFWGSWREKWGHRARFTYADDC